MPKVILKFEAALIKEIPIISSTLTVGRDPDNDVPIDHPTISRHHCRILLQGDTYFVEDLNSTNGTIVNDKKIIKAGIHNQDVVNLGKHSLIFVDDRPPQASVPTPPPVEPKQQTIPPVSVPQAQSLEPELKPIPKKGIDAVGGLRVMEGLVDQVEYVLTESSTYIGKSDRVAIKIKGMFAPEVAAMINLKTNGYYLVAIKEGYPKVNGIAIQGEQQLNEGDILEVGGTKLQFFLKSS